MVNITLYFKSSKNDVSFKLNVDENESLAKIRSIINEEKLEFFFSNYLLVHNNRSLDAQYGLKECGIKDGDTIEIPHIIKLKEQQREDSQRSVSKVVTLRAIIVPKIIELPTNRDVRGELIPGKIQELDIDGNPLPTSEPWTIRVRTVDDIQPRNADSFPEAWFEFIINVNQNWTGEQLKDEIARITSVRPNVTTQGRGQAYSGGAGGRLIFAGTDIEDSVKINVHRYEGGAALRNGNAIYWTIRIFKGFDRNQTLEKLHDMRQNGAIIDEEISSKLISHKLSEMNVSTTASSFNRGN